MLSNPKATFRLYASAEKLKKILPGNAEPPLSVDAASRLTWEQYEQLIVDVQVHDRIPASLQRAVEESGLSIKQIDAIDLVGGSTCIPAIRSKIQSLFPTKSLPTTLNREEACARGMLLFHARPFHRFSAFVISQSSCTSPCPCSSVIKNSVASFSPVQKTDHSFSLQISSKSFSSSARASSSTTLRQMPRQIGLRVGSYFRFIS